MASGADLFVVCKQCGSEVSPYVTECPYCGHRLRRRAPKLPRETTPRRRRGLSGRAARARGGAPVRTRGAAPRARRRGAGAPVRDDHAGRDQLRAVGCLARRVHLAGQAGRSSGRCTATGGSCSRSQFTYVSGWYAFATLIAIAIFGWLVERRHGPAVVLAVFLGAGATGALVAPRGVRRFPVVSGGNGAARWRCSAAWAVPDLQAARAGRLLRGRPAGNGGGRRAVCSRCRSRARRRAGWRA